MRLSAGRGICVTVMLLDGLVLARSPFDHSANYHSVIVFGQGTPVLEKEDKLRALRILATTSSPAVGMR